MDPMDLDSFVDTASSAHGARFPSAMAQCLQSQSRPLPDISTLTPPGRAENHHYDPVHNAWINSAPRSPMSSEGPGMAYWSFAPNHPWLGTDHPPAPTHPAFRGVSFDDEIHSSQWPRRTANTTTGASTTRQDGPASTQSTPGRTSSSTAARRYDASPAMRFAPGSRLSVSGIDLSRAGHPVRATGSPWETSAGSDSLLAHLSVDNPAPRDVNARTPSRRHGSSIGRFPSFTASRQSRDPSAMPASVGLGHEEDAALLAETTLAAGGPLPMLTSHHHDYDTERERFLAFARGRMAAASKRIPSKATLASFESLKPEELQESDRNCIICYNDFGVQNPEGITERPIRLPKCRHIFGDKCIKKWFEENDSCPYCRDKLPSQLTVSKTMFLEAMRLREQRQTLANRMGAASQQRETGTFDQAYHGPILAGGSTIDPGQRGNTQLNRAQHLDPDLMLAAARAQVATDHRRRRARRLADHEQRATGPTPSRPVSLAGARASSTSQVPILNGGGMGSLDFGPLPWSATLDHASSDRSQWTAGSAMECLYGEPNNENSSANLALPRLHGMGPTSPATEMQLAQLAQSSRNELPAMQRRSFHGLGARDIGGTHVPNGARLMRPFPPSDLASGDYALHHLDTHTP